MNELLLFYILTIFGMALMWNFAKIFIPVRNFVAKYFGVFKQPFLCGECSSFWIGFLFTLIIFQEKFIYSICFGLINYFFYFLFEKIYNKSYGND